MARNYWEKTVSARMSRRRAILAGAGGAAGAALIAACGGGGDGGDDSGGFRDASGLLTKPEDTTKSAKQGGVFPYYVTSEVITMDPLNNASSGTGVNNQAFAYSRFFQWKPGVTENPVGGEFVPDAAESYEVSPDGLRITFKLRTDIKFDPRPPTNGRTMTTEDVKFSWDRFSAGSLTRFDYVNALNPHAPIESLEVPDSRTAVFKIAFPTANMVSRFAFHRCLSIMPKEAEGGFDARTDQRGSGPWVLRKWEPSVGYTYDRNPNWHVRKGEPFLDTVQLTLIPEAAQRRAQLLAGNLWSTVLNAEEVIATKREQPRLSMYDDGYPWGGPNHIAFGFGTPDSPFQDARVRRALSMVIDRDLWVDSIYNVSKFESQGLAMDPRWNSHYSADDKKFWIDPQGQGLGEGAAYFKYNVEEATKLMRAAGHNQALKSTALVQGAGTQMITALHGMLQESGLFDLPIKSLTTNEYTQQVFNGQGKFEGIAMLQNQGVRGDIDQYLSTRWSPGGASGTQAMFPEVYPWYRKAQDLVTAQRRELDEKKRLVVLEDLQKELATQMPTVPWPGAANGFTLAWPHLANFGVFKGPATIDDASIIWPRFWYDESKRQA
jgi:ABC-type transport system substrate-binding protein